MQVCSHDFSQQTLQKAIKKLRHVVDIIDILIHHTDYKMLIVIGFLDLIIERCKSSSL